MAPLLSSVGTAISVRTNTLGNQRLRPETPVAPLWLVASANLPGVRGFVKHSAPGVAAAHRCKRKPGNDLALPG